MITLHVLKLEQNMHLTNDIEDCLFVIWLRQLARGEGNNHNQEITLPQHLLCSSNTVWELILHTYPDLSQPHEDMYFLQ